MRASILVSGQLRHAGLYLQLYLFHVYCLALGSADQRVVEWDAETGVMVEAWSFDDWIKSLAISNDEGDDRYLFAGSREGYLYVIDRAERRTIRKITQGHFDEITSMKILKGILYTASLDGTLRRWPIRELVQATAGEAELLGEVMRAAESHMEPPTVTHEHRCGAMTVEEEAELALLMDCQI